MAAPCFALAGTGMHFMNGLFFGGELELLLSSSASIPNSLSAILSMIEINSLCADVSFV